MGHDTERKAKYLDTLLLNHLDCQYSQVKTLVKSVVKTVKERSVRVESLIIFRTSYDKRGVNVVVNNVWVLVDGQANERLYMRPLFEFVLGMFKEIFGDEIMFAEPCVVFNDPAAPFPMLVTHSNPIMIRTTASDLKYWSRFIYEVAHELTHYAIRQQKKDKKTILRWFEETICEALSMYILRLAHSRWDKCPLYRCNPAYAQALRGYYVDIYNRTSGSVLRRCSSYADLRYIEDTCQDDREGRSIDRNYLFDTFISMPNDIKTVIYYTQYIQLNGLQVDFDTWKVDNKNSERFIAKLSSIQPAISVR